LSCVSARREAPIRSSDRVRTELVVRSDLRPVTSPRLAPAEGLTARRLGMKRKIRRNICFMLDRTFKSLIKNVIFR
jgi:hypothetical protein